MMSKLARSSGRRSSMAFTSPLSLNWPRPKARWKKSKSRMSQQVLTVMSVANPWSSSWANMANSTPVLISQTAAIPSKSSRPSALPAPFVRKARSSSARANETASSMDVTATQPANLLLGTSQSAAPVQNVTTTWSRKRSVVAANRLSAQTGTMKKKK